MRSRQRRARAGLLRKVVGGGLSALLLSTGLVAVLGAAPASAAIPGDDVYVGYADTLRPNPAAFPTPFGNGQGIVFEGCTSSCQFDAGAVRVFNHSGSAQSVTVTVSVDTCTFDIWPHNVSVASGSQLIVTQKVSTPNSGCLTDGNFDTSDLGPNFGTPQQTCNNDGVTPMVHVTIDGTTTSFADTGQVLNTGGVDKASCPPGTNESNQWSLIGTACGTATLTLAPPTQTHQAGASPATVTATFANSCNQPLPGALINFGVAAGPNKGTTGSGVTDASGHASFTYSSAVAGTDDVIAATQNPAGVIFSNGVTVIWTAPITMTGRAYGITADGLVKVPPTPDTGPVSTPAASSTATPCVVTVPAVIVVAHVLCAHVTTTLGPPTSTATASTADAIVALPGAPEIEVGAVQVASQTTCAGSTGVTNIALLRVGTNTITIPPTVPPNDKIVNIPGVLVITLNEQITGPGTLTVNGVHIQLLGTTEDVIVSSATSDIHNCPPA